MRRSLLVITMALALLAWAPPSAHAWYFPEHAELTRIGLTHYASPKVAEVIQAAIDEVRKNRWKTLPLCPEAGLPFAGTPLAADDVGKEQRPDLARLITAYAICIPYVGLPALAGDHAADVDDLELLITDAKAPPRLGMRRLSVGGMVVGASVDTWREFKAKAPVEFARAFEGFVPGGGGAQLIEPLMNRRMLVRDLDARLLLVDHDYTSRAVGSKAHFQNALKTVGDLVDELKTVGNTDNALGQMLAHHMRSMVLAVRARGESDPEQHAALTRVALLEHAFAIHFMQDAFAAGHIGTEHALTDPIRRLQRHDYLSQHGLAVRRAIVQRLCPPTTPDRLLHDGEDPYCWTAYGDGYLDVDNIPYAAEATARLQAQFALALHPRVGWEGLRRAAALHDRSALKVLEKVARLINPIPSWTSSSDPPFSSWLCDDEAKSGLLRRALDAVDSLEASSRSVDVSRPIGSGAQDGAQTAAAVLARSLLGEPLRPCHEGGSHRDALVCRSPPDVALIRWGHVDVQLWRPVLVAWPTAQADVRTLDGRESFGRGLAFQVGYGANGTWVNGGSVGGAGVIAVGGAVGLAYRADSIIPGRDNGAFGEINVGIAPSLVVGVPGRPTLYSTVAFAEVRVPVVPLMTLGFGYLSRSANVVDPVRLHAGVGLYGVRAYVLLPSTAGGVSAFNLLGWDLDVAYVQVGNEQIGRMATRGVDIPAELRLRVGRSSLLDVLAAPNSPLLGPRLTVGLELAGGFSWFL